MDFCIFTLIFPKDLMGMWGGRRHGCVHWWSYPDCETSIPSKGKIDGNRWKVMQGLAFGTFLRVFFCQATALDGIHFHSSL
jgi:hypothetical protein